MILRERTLSHRDGRHKGLDCRGLTRASCRAHARLRSVGSTQVIFSAEQASAALWTYGEDELADRALLILERDLPSLWAWAGDHWREDHELPLKARLVLDKITAFAAMDFLEGRVRPLKHERRRPRKAMPERLRNARPVAPGFPPR